MQPTAGGQQATQPIRDPGRKIPVLQRALAQLGGGAPLAASVCSTWAASCPLRRPERDRRFGEALHARPGRGNSCTAP